MTIDIAEILLMLALNSNQSINRMKTSTLFSDITNMTEEKIQKIQDYIKTHTCTDCLSDDSISNSSPRKSKKVFIFMSLGIRCIKF